MSEYWFRYQVCGLVGEQARVRNPGSVNPMRCAVVYGTRPEAIKLAPVARELRARDQDVILINTGQHDSLMPTVMQHFGLAPAVHLKILTLGQSLPTLAASLLTRLDQLFGELNPDCVIVQGDTSSAMAAALAAYYRRLPLAHVEAGLRTYQLYSPFPEEMNRRLISSLATWNFCPSDQAAVNLRAEQVPGQVYVTGNTVVDALETVRRSAPLLPLTHPCRVLATVHRRENFPNLGSIFRAFKEIAERTDVEFLIPVHANPVVKAAADEWLSGSNVRLIEPVDYVPWVGLLSSATLLITDSGGLQEEAPVLGVPLLIVRDVTERPEIVEGGFGYLVGTETARIVAFATRALNGELTFASGSPYGDGHASTMIGEILTRSLSAVPVGGI